jgi:UDP-glucose 4-epimerase
MIQTPEDTCSIFNLGKGQGNTVMEAIQSFEQVTGTKLNYILSDRRSGDVPAIYSDSSKAYKLLKWIPKYDIDDIMRTAYDFEMRCMVKAI